GESIVAGAVGMWKAPRLRFPRARGNGGKPAVGFPRFPQAVISTAQLPTNSATEPNFLYGCRDNCGLMDVPEIHILEFLLDRLVAGLWVRVGVRANKSSSAGKAR